LAPLALRATTVFERNFSAPPNRESGPKTGKKSGDFGTLTPLKNAAKSTY
jgi:hypothetical protein